MTDRLDDIPDLPRGFFWYEDRVPNAWRRAGMPAMQVRKRTLFGSKLIAQEQMPELEQANCPYERDLIRENAMRTLGKALGL